MLRRIVLFLGWLTFAVIVFVTLAPVSMRPHVLANSLEHVAAFSVTAFLLSVAYPKRAVVVFLLLVGAVVALEALQLLTPDRHARWTDAGWKILGVAIGAGSGALLARTLLRRR